MCCADSQPVEGCLPKFSSRVAAATRSGIPLRVSFPDLPGIDRLPATFGVPFPRGALRSADNVRVVTASGIEIPSGVRRTATWEGPDGDVRWVLIDCPIERGKSYLLEYGTEVKRAAVSEAVSVTDTTHEIVLDTGPLSLVFSKHESLLISAAKSGGRSILSPDRQKRMSIVDEAGDVAMTSDRPEDYEVAVEQAGPLHTIVKATGWYRRKSGEKLCQYVTRVHAYAGEPFVRVIHTFIVAYDTDKVRLKDICVPFVLDSAADVQASFGLDADNPVKHRGMANGYLLQAGHNRFVLCSAEGKKAAEGKRAGGWFDLSTGAAGLSIGLRHVWQEYPKELEIAGDEMRVHLWPPHGQDLLDWSARGQLGEELYEKWNRECAKLYKGGLDKYDNAIGVAKSNELLLSFHAGDRARAVSQCATLERPLVVSAGPDWMCKSDAFGRIGASDSSPMPDVERRMREGFEYFENMVRNRELYGMIHYGDVEGKGGRPWRRWASRFYGFPVVPWIMFARSADPRYSTFGLDNARHVMDIDMCHVTNEDYGKYPEWNPWGKRKGGRYGGNGGIIHYASNLYVLGCDSHVDQWLYAYYLTGYRRAWDILLEEGEYYRKLIENELDYYFRGYRHRMTGGALRTLIAIYRATWDKRYLKLAERAAGWCYEHAGADGVVRYDDGYMAPGLWTYYQATGDKRMLDLFLRCMREQGQETVPLYDTRAYSFYGPAMAYLATDDPTYLGRSLEWIDQFRTSSLAAYSYLTVHLQYVPYMVAAVAACDRPVRPRGYDTATDGEILLRRDKAEAFTLRTRWACYDRRFMSGAQFKRWQEYVKRHSLSARVVVRDANLQEVAATPIPLAGEQIRKGLVYASGLVDIAVPNGPPGVYRLAIESDEILPAMKLFLVSGPVKAVYDSSTSYVAFGNRFHFLVPEGRRTFGMRFKAQLMRTTLSVEVYDPSGRSVLTWKKELGAHPLSEYQPLEWEVPPGSDGKLWSFSFCPRNLFNERVYVQIDGHPYLATSPAAFFIPELELASRSTLSQESESRRAEGKHIAIPARKALEISRGAERGAGRYERIAASEGTIEFLVRPRWAPDDLNNRELVKCGKLYTYRRGSIGTYVVLGSTALQSGFAMAGGQWYHVTVVWGKSDKDESLLDTRLYVNGVDAGGQSQETAVLGDWTGASIRIGSSVPLDIDEVRVSDMARYGEDFDPGPFGQADEHALVQLDFEGPLPAFAKVK